MTSWAVKTRFSTTLARKNLPMQDILSDVKTAFDLFKESIYLFRSAKDLLPDSSEKVAAERTMLEAENSAKIAEAKLAQTLGFQLCPKEWPPVVLMATQVTRTLDFYKCPSCGTEFVNQSKRNNLVRLDEYTPSCENNKQGTHD
jgi:hypothetical protein